MSELPKILVIGKSGQLARQLSELAPEFKKQFHIDVLGRPDLDIVDRNSLASVFEKLSPQYVINASAYTAVDKAESEPNAAFAVNALGVHYLVQACLEHKAQLIHISTDYVFDGIPPADKSPLETNHPVAPLGVYGSSKLAGEWAVQALLPDAIIIRTSWVYSHHGQNFVKAMLKFGVDRDEMRIVADQYGRPTNVSDLAHDLLTIISDMYMNGVNNRGGVYHYSNTGEACSWYGFTKEIYRLATEKGLKAPSACIPIPSSDYPTPAKRPEWSVLSIDSIAQNFNLNVPSWKISLSRHFRDI